MPWRESGRHGGAPSRSNAWPAALTTLVDALQRETEGLRKLTAALVATRKAFASIRPSTIRSTAEDLQPWVDAVRREGARRSEAAAAVCKALGLEPGSPASRMAARLRSDDALALTRAATAAREAAAALKIENAVGSEMLDIAARAQDAMWRRLGAAAIEDGPEVYDQRSRARVIQHPRGGGLVDGHL